MSTPASAGDARSHDRTGIALMCVTMLVFAFQDNLSKHLAGTYNVFLVTAIRYWFMALLASVLAARHAGGLMATIRSRHPWAQLARGVLLATQICVMISSFVLLGVIETHAIFAATPLLIAALAGPLLGERIGWRRWTAIGVGFLGVLVILEPGFGVFSPYAPIAIVACCIFAAYTLLTRFVADVDEPATSFFWLAVVGMIVITPIGLWNWEPMVPFDAALMALLCVTSGTGHFLLIRVYAMSEANVVQPFSYLQLVFAAAIASTFLGESLETNVVVGAALVVAAGVFTILRSRRRS